MRSKFGEYKYYHTSKDNLELISEKSLKDTLKFMVKIIAEIEDNRIYVKNITGEPFLTKYNLINTTSFFFKKIKIYLQRYFKYRCLCI